MRKGPESAYNK